MMGRKLQLRKGGSSKNSVYLLGALALVGALYIWTSSPTLSSAGMSGSGLLTSQLEELKQRVSLLETENVYLKNLVHSSMGVSSDGGGGGGPPVYGAFDVMSKKSPPNRPSEGIDGIKKHNQIDVSEANKKRHFYGGENDPLHLGGFTHNDTDGQSPALWHWMLDRINMKSVVDVGCGRGISTKWFKDHKVKVTCVEGSSDAVKRSLLDPEDIIQHDFSRGPWWPEETQDVAWAVEFLEHVGRQYQHNYWSIFHKSALIFATHSYWGGWHHVEVHGDWWWRARMEAQGFVYSNELTNLARSLAMATMTDFRAQHLSGSLQVFINPAVASLPKHQHLIGGKGCYGIDMCGIKGACDCTGVDQLPQQFLPLVPRDTSSHKTQYEDEIAMGNALRAELKRKPQKPWAPRPLDPSSLNKPLV